MNKCPNCGAFYTNGKCDYCGTVFSRPLHADIDEENNGTLNYKGKTYNVRLLRIIETGNEELYADNIAFAYTDPRIEIHLEVLPK